MKIVPWHLVCPHQYWDRFLMLFVYHWVLSLLVINHDMCPSLHKPVMMCFGTKSIKTRGCWHPWLRDLLGSELSHAPPCFPLLLSELSSMWTLCSLPWPLWTALSNIFKPQALEKLDHGASTTSWNGSENRETWPWHIHQIPISLGTWWDPRVLGRYPIFRQSKAGWWFEPLWKIWVSWDDDSQCVGKSNPCSSHHHPERSLISKTINTQGFGPAPPEHPELPWRTAQTPDAHETGWFLGVKRSSTISPSSKRW